MPKLPLCLTIEQEIQRFVWQGQIVARPVPRQVRNDADALYQILTTLDQTKDRFRERKHLISGLCRKLRPIRKATLAREESDEDEVVGAIELTEDGLRFLGKIFNEPPEGMRLDGSTVEVDLAIEDAIDALKKKADEPVAKPEEPEKMEV